MYNFCNPGDGFTPLTCDGWGSIPCRCGGDLCVCWNRGELECPGCVDCEKDDDDDFFINEDEE